MSLKKTLLFLFCLLIVGCIKEEDKINKIILDFKVDKGGNKTIIERTYKEDIFNNNQLRLLTDKGKEQVLIDDLNYFSAFFKNINEKEVIVVNRKYFPDASKDYVKNKMGLSILYDDVEQRFVNWDFESNHFINDQLNNNEICILKYDKNQKKDCINIFQLKENKTIKLNRYCGTYFSDYRGMYYLFDYNFKNMVFVNDNQYLLLLEINNKNICIIRKYEEINLYQKLFDKDNKLYLLLNSNDRKDPIYLAYLDMKDYSMHKVKDLTKDSENENVINVLNDDDEFYYLLEKNKGYKSLICKLNKDNKINVIDKINTIQHYDDENFIKIYNDKLYFCYLSSNFSGYYRSKIKEYDLKKY